VRRRCPSGAQAIIGLDISTGVGTMYIALDGFACLYDLRLETR
jgi:hypothetical protein